MSSLNGSKVSTLGLIHAIHANNIGTLSGTLAVGSTGTKVTAMTLCEYGVMISLKYQGIVAEKLIPFGNIKDITLAK